MKASHILYSLFIMGVFTNGALAALPLPGGKCYEINGGADYNMIIYFENDYPKRTDTNFTDINGMFSSATGGARTCYSNMKTALRSNIIDKITQPDEAIFLLASTDALASAEYNVKLATRRAGFAVKALKEAGLLDDIIRNQVKLFIGGESNAATESTGSKPEERAIRIIVKQANTYTPPVEYHEVNLTNNITIEQTNNQSTNFSSTTHINLNYDDSQLIAQNARTQIGLLASELNSMNDKFEKSHWKTASGNFNGARLASDSIAGVVLGTAGGLITSNIVKKNQVRSGFEDLQCVVGGQIVANYNDEFHVNIR